MYPVAYQFLEGMHMKTRMYVDGFNLFNRILKGRGPGYKWIDLPALGEHISAEPIDLVRYFSASIRKHSNISLLDYNEKRANQQALFNAYRLDPRIELHMGLFQVKDKSGMLVNKYTRKPLGLCSSLPKLFTGCIAAKGVATIQAFEEKKTDVNIASYLLKDAYEGNVDLAIVVSNDSDLYEPLRICKEDLGIKVIAVNPVSANMRKHARRNQLIGAASQCYELRPGIIKKHQMTSIIRYSKSMMQKPKSW